MGKKVLSPEQRWERGIPHDDRSENLIRELISIDRKYNSGNIDIRTGGDGDNGEDLMYLLDIYFELEDRRREGETISDGFGSTWSKQCPSCKGLTMQVVRPGKVQCGKCG